MTRRTVIVGGKAGIHARPATEIVRVASGFESDMRIKLDDRDVDVKSVLAIMSLAIRPGTEVSIEADGKDEQPAVEALARLLEGA